MTTHRNTLPKFKSRKEEAAWIEAHMADLWDEAKPVKVRFAKNLSAGLNIRLDPDSLETTRGGARKRDGADYARTDVD
jgi:hypothetical protein